MKICVFRAEQKVEITGEAEVEADQDSSKIFRTMMNIM